MSHTNPSHRVRTLDVDSTSSGPRSQPRSSRFDKAVQQTRNESKRASKGDTPINLSVMATSGSSGRSEPKLKPCAIKIRDLQAKVAFNQSAANLAEENVAVLEKAYYKTKDQVELERVQNTKTVKELQDRINDLNAQICSYQQELKQRTADYDHLESRYKDALKDVKHYQGSCDHSYREMINGKKQSALQLRNKDDNISALTASLAAAKKRIDDLEKAATTNELQVAIAHNKVDDWEVI
ncbi:hypothetical protein AMS68_003831 [Peltaster fructicola]|uniref:Uncharacterized protein n=1 Tax=Peltaster fructicola TaxID=286661 RepID=A0A6H0XUA5_9PEZI|nr:hypothetical protein AMS68_003831 [Peltaster fructicola]